MISRVPKYDNRSKPVEYIHKDMEYARNDMRNIAFESINEKFSKGKYLGIEVTICTRGEAAGYINGNHLVKQAVTKNGQPKEFRKWKENNEAKELINYLQSGDFPPDHPKPLLIEIINVPNELKGTYVDPTLIGHLAMWASPVLAHKVLLIVRQYAIDAAITEKNAIAFE